MSDVLSNDIGALVRAAGLQGGYREVVLRSGANNRVSRLDGDDWQVVLKRYFRDRRDPRDRLGAEYGFLTFAAAHGIRAVPQPIAVDEPRGLALYEFIDGGVGARAAPTLTDVRAAIAFFAELNRWRRAPDADRIKAASEACFSVREHVEMLERRITALADLVGPVSEFARLSLIPIFERIAASVQPHDRGMLVHDQRCLSPSDFGFHNAILTPDGDWRFIDFEYAGWDDPAKLVCDFFCQPKIPVAESLFETFVDGISEALGQSGDLSARASLLLPLYRLKWACIMLSHALPAGAARRTFAGVEESDMTACIARARSWLESHGLEP
jgi:hypothetical protein